MIYACFYGSNYSILGEKKGGELMRKPESKRWRPERGRMYREKDSGTYVCFMDWHMVNGSPHAIVFFYTNDKGEIERRMGEIKGDRFDQHYRPAQPHEIVKLAKELGSASYQQMDRAKSYLFQIALSGEREVSERKQGVRTVLHRMQQGDSGT